MQKFLSQHTAVPSAGWTVYLLSDTCAQRGTARTPPRALCQHGTSPAHLARVCTQQFKMGYRNWPWYSWYTGHVWKLASRDTQLIAEVPATVKRARTQLAYP